MSLKRARKRRDEARSAVADGVDPMAKRRADRAAKADTFAIIAREWFELQSKALAAETTQILGARLKSFLYPYIGSRPVKAILAQELLAALRRIEAWGKHESAHRVRALAGLATWNLWSASAFAGGFKSRSRLSYWANS